MKFRNDISFLRALSVLMVMLFHFQVPFFNGGFIGVDCKSSAKSGHRHDFFKNRYGACYLDVFNVVKKKRNINGLYMLDNNHYTKFGADQIVEYLAENYFSKIDILNR